MKTGRPKAATSQEIALGREPTGIIKVNKSIPKIPLWLSIEAKKIWKKLSKELNSMGVLNKIDQNIFAIYCDNVAKYIAESKRLDNEQDGKTQALKSLFSNIIQLSKELGLTPYSRSKLVVAEDNDNGWEEFLT